MTITAQTAADNRASFVGNGVATSFAFGKPFTAQADLVVNLVLIASPFTATPQVLNTDYTVSGTADAQGRYGSGANIVFVTAPSSLYNVVVYADPSIAQGLDLVENDPMPAEQIELALDKCALQDRRARDILSRVFRLTDSSVSTGALSIEPIASQFLGFDASKNLITIAATAGGAVVSTFMATVLDDTTAPNARLTLGAAASVVTTKGDLYVGGAAGAESRLAVGADGTVLVADSSQTKGLAWGFHNHGQCQLTKSSANLLLSPFNGNKLIINSTVQAVPDAGVTLAPPAVASTAYYIYAFMNAGVMTLENVATAPAVQAGTGVKIKTGDATRTLVGQARTTAGNAWADTATQRFVRSWFNDGGFAAQNTFSADRSTASATYVELNSEIRTEFLAWSGETITCAADGSWVQTAGGGAGSTGIGFDGAALDPTFETLGFSEVAAHPEGFTLAGAKSTLAEGYHFATLLGRTNGNTGTWSSASATNAAKNYLHVSSNGH